MEKFLLGLSLKYRGTRQYLFGMDHEIFEGESDRGRGRGGGGTRKRLGG